MSKSQKGKIYYTMQAISLLPILLLGLLILAFGTISFTKSMTQEVFDHLDTSAHLFISLIDSNYPGDYTLKEYQIDGQTVYSVYKGNHEISGLHSMVDHFKKDTNMDTCDGSHICHDLHGNAFCWTVKNRRYFIRFGNWTDCCVYCSGVDCSDIKYFDGKENRVWGRFASDCTWDNGRL